MTGLLAALLLATSVSIHADELSDPGIWHGEWQAEDTDFTLLVLPSGTNFRLEPLRPAGIEWQAGEGLINGSSGTVEVSYQGVVAQVMVQLTSPETAVVRSMSCQPDYHVVCTLVRNQQARFIKLQ
ncbi:hypothetical protein LCGC14_0061330 [marine sediment metagenome]|uniref:Uncharacterized protein n=2 Tax=root TaxID=1 RepID=A0A0F9Y4T9_9ZZZZ